MMQVKRYVANTFAEALIQAKSELGTDAIIVESKKLKVGGFLGFFRREVTELTVAVDTAQQPKKPPRPAPASGYLPPGVKESGQTPAQRQAQAAYAAAAQLAATTAVEPAPAPAATNITSLEKEVASLRTAVARLVGQAAGGPAATLELQGFARQVFESLVSRGVDEAAALEVASRIPTGGTEGQELVRQELNRLLGPWAPIQILPGQRKIVALVGPTGVGKTTTVAKLAAKFSLEQGLAVGLITADTYRIAAVEQLRTYADILGIPLYTAETPNDLAYAMRATADCNLVLVDTAGRNHRSPEQMAELKEMLAVLRPDETHLVCSLTSNPKDALEILDTYLPYGVNRLTLTKLDEATSPGLILTMRRRANQPLGYVTHGQSVPEDIVPADRVDFIKVLVGA